MISELEGTSAVVVTPDDNNDGEDTSALTDRELLLAVNAKVDALVAAFTDVQDAVMHIKGQVEPAIQQLMSHPMFRMFTRGGKD